MKKLWEFLKDIFTYILALVLAFVVGICLLIMLPFDYIKYRRSHYYRHVRKKYTMFAGSGTHFDLYNEILKNDLPIRFVENPESKSLATGWFVFRDTLVIPNVFSFAFDESTGSWNYSNEDEDEKQIIMSLDEYIEMEIEDANRGAGKIICSNAVVLIDSDELQDHLAEAKAEPRFLVYDGNREAVLKEFCGSNDAN